MRTAKRVRPATKEKKSYTLSRSSVLYLKRLHKERAARSVSEVLDSIIREAAALREREEIDRAVSAYYDNLTPEEERELRAWGDFAVEQLRGPTK